MNELPNQACHSWKVMAAYLMTCVAFAIPYLLLAELGPRLFFRNWIRALSGPGLELVAHWDFGINALRPHLVVVVVLLPMWLGFIRITRLRELPVAVHVGLASIWCGYGFFRTLAI